MNIKTKSIITLCLTALASMPLSAQSYLGSVFEKEDGTWTRAKNISVGENKVTVTDYDSNSYTITNSHGSTASIKVVDNVLYCANDESLTSDLVKTALKTGCLTLSGTLNNHNWSLLNEGKLNGITSARFYKVNGDEAFTALSNLKCSSLSSVTFEDCSFPNVTSLEKLLYESAITSFTWGGMEVSENLNTLENMFSGCNSLQSVSLEGLKTSNVTSLGALFYNCNSLSSINLSGCVFSNVTECSSMFSGCSNLQSIDLSGHNLKNVTNSFGMFKDCEKLTSINFADCDFSKVTGSKWMFYQCKALQTVDLSGAKLSSKDCYGMFMNCGNLNSVNLSGCNFNGVTTCYEMFKNCSALKEIDLSGCSFKCADNASLTYMFYNCTSLETVDFSNCDLSSNSTSHQLLFTNCKALKTIRAVGCNQTTITKLREAIELYKDYLCGVNIVTSDTSSEATAE